MTSIWRKPTNRANALIRTCLLGLNGRAYTEVSGHAFPPTCSPMADFVVQTLYQLGMYANPDYTLIAVGFGLHDCLVGQQAGRLLT